MSDVENHTLALLREMRAAMDGYQQENKERFERLERRLDAMHANGVKALAQVIGHRAMVERTTGSFEKDVPDLKGRVEVLETAS